MKQGGYAAILLEREEGIVRLTMNRPRQLNAFNRQMRDEMYAALDLVACDPSVRVLMLRGAGKAFSAGGDIAEFGTAPSPVRAREVRQIRDVWARLRHLPCLSIAAVHGVAAGGGLEMALLCDLLVCTRDVRLGVPETGLGAIPGVGGTQTLPRAIGAGRAAALLLLGEWIDGREAERLGFANHAVAPAGLETVVRRLALRLSRIEPAVVRAVKESLRRGRDLPLPQALGLERRLASKLRVEAP